MFKVFRLTIVAIVAIATFQVPTSTAALAKEKWVSVGKDNYQHYHLWVDTNSLKRNGNFAWFWFRGSSIAALDPKLRIYFVDTYASIDCQGGVIRLRSMRAYDKNQKFLPAFSGDYKSGAVGPVNWKDPVIRYVCRR